MLSSSQDKRDVFLYRDRAEFSLTSQRDNDDVVRLFAQLASRCEMCEHPNELFDFFIIRQSCIKHTLQSLMVKI